jgi:tRNA (cmo5U34)-methyltransferase
MNRDETAALFDKQAAGYDSQWSRMAPVRDGLYILGVGVGTGAELAYLAARNPQWRFTAVEPSREMLDLCRRRAAADGFEDRCTFHHGFLETLGSDLSHDAATCFLVSQFLTDRSARAAFFRDIATRLRPAGILVNADLSSNTGADDFETLLPIWLDRMSATRVAPEAIARARAAYATDVAVLPAEQVQSIIEAAGFTRPVPFYQAGLLHAWCARRTAYARA